MTTNVFKFIWQYLSKLKWWFFAVLLCVLLGETFFRVFMYYGARVADLLASSMTKDEILHQSLILIGFSGICLVLHRFCYDFSTFLEAKFLPLFLSRLMKDLFNYTHKHSTAFFAEEMAGNVSGKVKTIVDDTYQMYFNLLWGFIYPTFSILVTLVMVLDINTTIATIMLIFIIVYVVIIFNVSKRVAPYSEARAKAMSEANGILVDSISNVTLVKSFSSILFERKHFFKYIKNAAYKERSEIKKYFELFIYQGVFRALLQFVFILLPVWYWYKSEITIGDFVLIQGLTYSLNGLFLHFTHNFMQFFKLYGGIQDGLKLLSKPYDIVDAPNAKDLKAKKGEIIINNVTYHYKGSEALFKNFNLEIKASEKIGLVGHSGSGKSTLVKILSRYYDIQKGSIKIDGQDISKVTQSSLRKNIALIPQDPSLFNRTIMENIRYGNVKATDQEVFEAAKKAYIHDFIMTMPKGYDSKVGERGVMLSGGERQRIAIARAILKNAPILILDEATSALDSSSEKYIQDSMKDLMKGKTVIAIAHRLSTLKEMDKLVVMDKGNIIEEGTHTSLLRKKSAYYKFFEMQSQGFLGS